jgi:hypothetical protein
MPVKRSELGARAGLHQHEQVALVAAGDAELVVEICHVQLAFGGGGGVSKKGWGEGEGAGGVWRVGQG